MHVSTTNPVGPKTSAGQNPESTDTIVLVFTGNRLDGTFCLAR